MMLSHAGRPDGRFLNLLNFNIMADDYLEKALSRIPSLTGKDKKDKGPFQPRFPETAKFESGILRTKSDPNAVGGISSGKQDVGRRSYGTYQIRSQEIANFVRGLPDTAPYKKLKSLVTDQKDQTDAFNAEHKKVAAERNKEYGTLQEDFRIATGSGAQKRVVSNLGIQKLSRYPDRFIDYIFGFVNQYGATLAPKAAVTMGKDLRVLAEQKGEPISMNEIVNTMSDYRVKNAHINFAKIRKKFGDKPIQNLRKRFENERKSFSDPKEDFTPTVQEDRSPLRGVDASQTGGQKPHAEMPFKNMIRSLGEHVR